MIKTEEYKQGGWRDGLEHMCEIPGNNEDREISLMNLGALVFIAFCSDGDIFKIVKGVPIAEKINNIELFKLLRAKPKENL